MLLKRSAALLTCMALMAVSTVACSSVRPRDRAAGGTGGRTVVGISMPTVSLERWNNDGAQLSKKLQELGYETSLEYADNKNELQIQQVENQINAGADILVIASIDGRTLGPTLAKAKARGVTVIAYDRLIMSTADVDYYATFDNYQVGARQGEFVVNALRLTEQSGPFNLEPFAGSPDDNNAKLFFEGAWDQLKPYVDAGSLAIQSETGKKAASNWQDIGILEWKAATAQSDMENRLNSYYRDKKVDVVLSPNDSLALGIAQALQGSGYQVGVDWPVLTGQDADLANVKNIMNGKQSMTVWKDTRVLADRVAAMVDQVAKGGEVEVNNTEDYDNGVKIVPAFLLEPVVVTKDNVQSDLVDTGFINADELA